MLPRLLPATALALASLAPLSTPAAPPSPARWAGEARLPGAAQPLVLDLDRQPDGTWRAQLTLPGRAMSQAPLTGLKVDDQGLQAELSAAFPAPSEPPPRLQLRWTGPGAAQGQLSLAGLQAPVSLRAQGPAQFAPALAPSLPIDDRWLGRWTGRYELGDIPRELTLTLSRNAQGQVQGQVLVIGRRRFEAPADSVSLARDGLRVQIAAAGVLLEGPMDEQGLALRLYQGPFDVPLRLQRSQETQP